VSIIQLYVCNNCQDKDQGSPCMVGNGLPHGWTEFVGAITFGGNNRAHFCPRKKCQEAYRIASQKDFENRFPGFNLGFGKHELPPLPKIKIPGINDDEEIETKHNGEDETRTED
jgi:hypothetical protein